MARMSTTTRRGYAGSVARLVGLALMGATPWLLLGSESVRATLLGFVEAVRGAGALGVVMFAGFYSLGVLVGLPFVFLSGLAGFTLGWIGAAVAIPSAAIGAAGALVIGRAVVARMPARWRAGDRMALALRAVIAKEGRRVALLLRLSPVVPQNLLSFALAGTSLRARDMALATAIGLAPVIAVQAYLGSIAESAVAAFNGDGSAKLGTGRIVLTAVGVLLTAVLLIIVAKRAKLALKEVLDSSEPAQSS